MMHNERNGKSTRDYLINSLNYAGKKKSFDEREEELI